MSPLTGLPKQEEISSPSAVGLGHNMAPLNGLNVLALQLGNT
jgi:hypothetical protein